MPPMSFSELKKNLVVRLSELGAVGVRKDYRAYFEQGRIIFHPDNIPQGGGGPPDGLWSSFDCDGIPDTREEVERASGTYYVNELTWEIIQQLLDDNEKKPIKGLRMAAKLLGKHKTTFHSFIGRLPERLKPTKSGNEYVWSNRASLDAWWEKTHEWDRQGIDD